MIHLRRWVREYVNILSYTYAQWYSDLWFNWALDCLWELGPLLHCPLMCRDSKFLSVPLAVLSLTQNWLQTWLTIQSLAWRKRLWCNMQHATDICGNRLSMPIYPHTPPEWGLDARSCTKRKASLNELLKPKVRCMLYRTKRYTSKFTYLTYCTGASGYNSQAHWTSPFTLVACERHILQNCHDEQLLDHCSWCWQCPQTRKRFPQQLSSKSFGGIAGFSLSRATGPSLWIEKSDIEFNQLITKS